MLILIATRIKVKFDKKHLNERGCHPLDPRCVVISLTRTIFMIKSSLPGRLSWGFRKADSSLGPSCAVGEKGPKNRGAKRANQASGENGPFPLPSPLLDSLCSLIFYAFSLRFLPFFHTAEPGPMR